MSHPFSKHSNGENVVCCTSTSCMQKLKNSSSIFVVACSDIELNNISLFSCTNLYRDLIDKDLNLCGRTGGAFQVLEAFTEPLQAIMEKVLKQKENKKQKILKIKNAYRIGSCFLELSKNKNLSCQQVPKVLP